MYFNQRPEIVRRLVLSASRALPVDATPWDSLAMGLQLSRNELSHMIDSLYAEGGLLGIWGELNPAISGIKVQIAPFPHGSSLKARSLRWLGRKQDGGVFVCLIQNSDPVAASGSSVLRWYKAGIPFQGGLLLESGGERSFLCDSAHEVLEPPREDIERLTDALETGLRIRVQGDFWHQIAVSTGTTSAAARDAVRRLVYTKRWRRFSLRFDPARIGFAGCGLAIWELDETEVDPAARALASLRLTSDVMRIEPSEQLPGNLAALCLAIEPGAGQRAVYEIARQWSRNPVRWVPLDLSTAMRTMADSDS